MTSSHRPIIGNVRIATARRRVPSDVVSHAPGGSSALAWHGELGRTIAELQAHLDAEGLDHAGEAEYVIEVQVPVVPRAPRG